MILKKIIVKKKNVKHLDHITLRLKEQCNGLLFKSKTDGDFIKMHICTYDNINNSIFDAKLCEILADIITIDYKSEFYKQNLRFKLNDAILDDILVKTMVGFSQNADRLYVLMKLENQKIISLDGTYDFQLKDLKERWRSILPPSVNGLPLANTFTCYTEYLKLLMERMETRYEQVHIYKDEQGYSLKDKHDRIIKVNEKLAHNDNDEIKLIISLIGLAPKQIFLHNNPMHENTYKLLTQIFE